MKYPTGEYRTLLCLYQQLQKPEPVMFSRSLREHHVLFLANTSALKLYFVRQGPRYWLINEKPCLGLPAFRHPAGQPGRFFIPSLKNSLCVKLHHVLDNNACARHWFRQALVREAERLFQIAMAHLVNHPPRTLFTFCRSVCIDNHRFPSPSRVLGQETVYLALTLRQNGLGDTTLDITVHYHPLPFARQRIRFLLSSHRTLQEDDTLAILKTQLRQRIAEVADQLFHSS